MIDILVTSMPQLKLLYPTNQDWKKIKFIIMLLELIYEVTKLLSSSNHPTIRDLQTVFLVITTFLTKIQNQPSLIETHIAQKITEKLYDYWKKLQSYFYELVLFDLSTKFITFKSYTKKYNACQMIYTTYQAYESFIEN